MQPQAAAAASAAGYQRSFVSQHHKTLLVQLVRRDYELLTNRSIYSRQQRHDKWQDIADQLNSLHSSCYKVPAGWQKYFSAMRDQVFLKRRRWDAQMPPRTSTVMSDMDVEILELCRDSYERLYAAAGPADVCRPDGGHLLRKAAAPTNGGGHASVLTSSSDSSQPPSPIPRAEASSSAAKRRRTGEPVAAKKSQQHPGQASAAAATPQPATGNGLEQFNDRVVFTLQNNELLREHNALLRQQNDLLQLTFRDERKYRAEMLAMKRRQLELMERQEVERRQQQLEAAAEAVVGAAVVKQETLQGAEEDTPTTTGTERVKEEPVDDEFILN